VYLRAIEKVAWEPEITHFLCELSLLIFFLVLSVTALEPVAFSHGPLSMPCIKEETAHVRRQPLLSA
jgi:hypothetical protein